MVDDNIFVNCMNSPMTHLSDIPDQYRPKGQVLLLTSEYLVQITHIIKHLRKHRRCVQYRVAFVVDSPVQN